jgi:E3 ubiquitin-protein ligase BRE1
MRDKEAVDVERKNLSRNLEKQSKLLERLYENERNLRDQVVSLPEKYFQLRSDPALGPPREGSYRA